MMLCNYKTGETIRKATREEYEASVAAAESDGGRGAIEVDGVACYVEGEPADAKETTVTVRANPDADDCLAHAVETYIAKHPELKGWELAPRWADDARESVVLTVPAWSV